MGSYGILAVAASLALGTVLGQLSSADARSWSVVAFSSLCLYTTTRDRRYGILRTALVLAFAAGYTNAWWHLATAAETVASRTIRFEGTVLTARESASGNGRTYVVRLTDGRHVLLSCAQFAVPGEDVIVRGRLERFDDVRNPGETSEREIERERGLDAKASGSILAKKPSRDISVDVLLARTHEWAFGRFESTIGEPGASILAGELWGARSSLPTALHDAFAATGTVHVLVTAGLHVGFVAAIALFLLARVTVPRAVSCVCAGLAIWCFVVSSGAALPAIRAATMATAMLTARAYGRASRSWNSLALAAIVVCAVDPFGVATASFALSFCCVAAIFACSPVLETILERCEAWMPRSIREAIVLTTATQLGTWPVAAAVFLQVPAYAVPANLLVVPCVPVTMLLGIAQLMTTPLPALAAAIGNCNGWILAWIAAIVQTIAAVPFATMAVTPPAPLSIAAYELALVASAAAIRRGGAVFGISLLAFAASLAIFPFHLPTRTLLITAIDVGQADALLIRTPAGHTFLVDAGGKLERGPAGADSIAERVGERTVVPMVLRSGALEVDAAILTHPHGDHAGGMAPLMRRLRVDAFADSGQRYTGHAYLDALATARRSGVPTLYPRLGDRWSTDDGVTFTFLGPSLPFIQDSGNDVNDNSIAFVLQYRQFRMLFTGDAGTEAEQRFLRSGIDLHADVLKVGHHGSAYGTAAEFLAAVHPRYAVISVGRHNTFGHPAPATLERLRAVGARIYRTDRDGAIVITTDGSATSIHATVVSDGSVPPLANAIEVGDKTGPRRIPSEPFSR